MKTKIEIQERINDLNSQISALKDHVKHIEMNMPHELYLISARLDEIDILLQRVGDLGWVLGLEE